MLQSLRRLLAVLAVAAAVPCFAANKPTPGDIQRGVIEYLKQQEVSASRLSGMPVPDTDKDLLVEQFVRLFQEQSVQQFTQEWLRANEGAAGDDLYARWLLQYIRMVSGGLLHWTDEDVAFALRSSLNAGATDEAECIRISSADVKLKDLGPDISREDVRKYLSIVQRTFLAVLDNKVPRPMPTDERVQAALARAVLLLPQKDKDRYVVLTGDPPTSIEGQCELTRIYTTAVLAAQGDDGRVLRRAYFVQNARAFFEGAPGMPGGSRSNTNMQPDGRFEPGTVRLEYPRLAAKAGLEGDMRVKIRVDESGFATRVEVVERKFNKPSAALSDGTVMTVEELFDPVVTVYYRSGRFQQRFENGKPAAYSVEVPLSWKLE